ncbi:FAD-binding protein [Celeribacter neptunius]|uniref:Glycolate oxidase FAD binding subunit n=1 Tax=Celeribacter neptunius TaxID=588602 RepID=A0A1I3QQ85_9RHOB|nr:FAD-binding protein [Celeribacter neptunius]SFJ36373.1 glycolate oxidase FAD binding subunit [Celeribacter neptunius]
MSILAARNAGYFEERDRLADQIRAGGPFLCCGQGTSRIGLADGVALSAPGEAWDYDPSALTLTVAAGVPLETVEAVLASENQRLAFEPPDMRGLLGRAGAPSIGGVLAGNLSGPRRVGVGACRDFCLGVEFIDGRGQVVKNGGRVMKNVTGLDLVKLMAGSHGTLGLITEVSLKVAPIPEMSATLMIEGLGEAEAVQALSTALGTPFDVTGAAHLREDGAGGASRTLIRLEGFENSLRYRMGALQEALKRFGDSDILWDATANAGIWQAIRDVSRFHAAGGDVWRVSVKPSEAAALVQALDPLDVIYDWGGNRLWLLTEAGSDLRAKMAATGTKAHATLIRASDATKRRLGVFHSDNPVTARLAAGLRQKFDPDQKFNRGMMG